VIPEAVVEWAMRQCGYNGLWDRRCRRPSPRRVPLELAERVLALYREHYFDFHVRHFHEKLREQHGITLSYTWAKLALRRAGLVAKGRRRGVHRRRRPRRPLPRMLHLDGTSQRGLWNTSGGFSAEGITLPQRKRQPKALKKTEASPPWKTLRVSHFSTAAATMGSLS
jgi:hypothetical protein